MQRVTIIPITPDGIDIMQTSGNMWSDASTTNNIVTTIITTIVVITDFMVVGMAHITARSGLGITGEHLPEAH